MIELFKYLKIPDISYIDIGACHPTHFSNTYLLYENGHRGILVEPNPALYEHIRKSRPGDMCLNVGISIGTTDEAPFYIMKPPTLSTFSKEEADRLQHEGVILDRIASVKTKNINVLIEEYCKTPPNFISLDIEGLDATILNTFDFKKNRPEIFCIETLSYSSRGHGTKDTEIFNIMSSNGYEVHADTHLNTIFIDTSKKHG